MLTERRNFTLAKDQPILRSSRRRSRAKGQDREHLEIDFWKSFNLEKFARDWQRGVGRRKARG
jgi:hypothetical protein